MISGNLTVIFTFPLQSPETLKSLQNWSLLRGDLNNMIYIKEESFKTKIRDNNGHSQQLTVLRSC